MTYRFEWSDRRDFQSGRRTGFTDNVPEGGGDTAHEIVEDLAPNTLHYWRARATGTQMVNGTEVMVTSDYSQVRSFTTPNIGVVSSSRIPLVAPVSGIPRGFEQRSGQRARCRSRRGCPAFTPRRDGQRERRRPDVDRTTRRDAGALCDQRRNGAAHVDVAGHRDGGRVEPVHDSRVAARVLLLHGLRDSRRRVESAVRRSSCRGQRIPVGQRSARRRACRHRGRVHHGDLDTRAGVGALYDVEIGHRPGQADAAVLTTTQPSVTYRAGARTSYLRVREVRGATVSAPSNEVSVAEAPSRCTGAPLDPILLPVSTTNGETTISWLPGGGALADRYRVDGASPRGRATMTSLGSGTSLTARLEPGTYTLRVTAINACGASAASNEVVIDVP